MNLALLSSLIVALRRGRAKLLLSRRRVYGWAGASPSQVLLLALACMLPLCGGCSLIVPQKAMRPVIRNPFPQLSRIAVAPFANQSDEPTVDGRQVALAYFAELQSTPGFEVVPLGVVEEAIIAHRVDLSGAGEARRLARILGVDVVVVGAITDFSEYYPPRIGLRVEWYTANPGFHNIPAGYGLPWGTPEEEFIPDSLVYESQMALAKAEFAAKTPDCDGVCQPLSAPPAAEVKTHTERIEAFEAEAIEIREGVEADRTEVESSEVESTEIEVDSAEGAADQTRLKLVDNDSGVRLALAEEPLPAGANAAVEAPAATDTTGAAGGAGALPLTAPQSPDPHSLAPAAAAAAASLQRPPCVPWNGPVLSHTRIYRGNDADVTDALEGYVSFRDDHRFGGWRSYLARNDDFVRFCCHMHICEMLSARGGSRKTDVVYRWPDSR
ncbi:MAG: hypothetical protein H0T51_00440 [Pirellulales bacterium]|nr:hypothetical protein [Pirellulales bacterium]